MKLGSAFAERVIFSYHIIPFSNNNHDMIVPRLLYIIEEIIKEWSMIFSYANHRFGLFFNITE